MSLKILEGTSGPCRFRPKFLGQIWDCPRKIPNFPNILGLPQIYPRGYPRLTPPKTFTPPKKFCFGAKKHYPKFLGFTPEIWGYPRIAPDFWDIPQIIGVKSSLRLKEIICAVLSNEWKNGGHQDRVLCLPRRFPKSIWHLVSGDWAKHLGQSHLAAARAPPT